MWNRKICLALLAAVMVASLPRQVVAQSGEDIAKGLLRALIESQLEKSRRGGREEAPPPGRRPGQGNLRPGQVTPEMLKLRPIAASFAQESATLAALLNTESQSNFELRRRLPDAIRIQAAATALSQRCAAQRDHAAVLDGFRELNTEWITLHHQLDQARVLSPQGRAVLRRLSGLDTQYCSLLNIQEQFDSSDLIREAYSLTAYLRDLSDDVRDQHYRAPETRSLHRDLGRMSQEADYFAALVSRGVQFRTAVTEYQELYKSWQGIQGALSTLTGHTISRNVRRIQESHRTIHELLRLDMGVDKDLVLNMVHEIDHELVELFRTITLEQLMGLPDANAVPAAADALYGNIQNLDDLAHRDESQQAVAEAWVYADEAWSVFAYYLAPVRNPQAQATLRSIAQTMSSLKRTMGITVAFDRQVLVQSASSLEQMGEHLVSAIRRWHAHPGNHNSALVQQAQKLVDQCHSLEQTLIAGRDMRRASRECDEAIRLWQVIRPELTKCDTDERETIEHIVSSFTPGLIRLRTMLGE